jgi:hypothetical protein
MKLLENRHTNCTNVVAVFLNFLKRCIEQTCGILQWVVVSLRLFMPPTPHIDVMLVIFLKLC